MCKDRDVDDEARWSRVPEALRVYPHWVVWKVLPRDDAIAKLPYDPRTGTPAKSNDPTTWASFAEATDACVAAQGMEDHGDSDLGYAGIGYVFSADDPYVGVDLDACRDLETGDIAASAQNIIERLDSYTEVSPSGTGLHIVVRGTLPPGRRRQCHIEMYDAGRYFTVTGNHLVGTPRIISDCQDELAALYDETFAARNTTGQMDARRIERAPQGQARRAEKARKKAKAQLPPAAPQTPVTLSDEEVLAIACAAMNGQKVRDLYDGYWEEYYTSSSEADLGLCRLLAFYTQDEEQLDRLFSDSGLYRDKWEREDYRTGTLRCAIADLETAFQPAKQQRAEAVTFHYGWQVREEAPGERDAVLQAVTEQMQWQASEHFDAQRNAVLVLASPPGVGKSHAIAELGTLGGVWNYNIAWIAERKNMREQVPALQHYNAIQPCTPDNCPDHRLHELLLAAGRNTWPIHKQHGCAYSAQFQQDMSAIYQLPHVQTAYPARHDAIVIDELNLANWLQEKELTRRHLLREANHAETSPTGRHLLRAVLDVLHRLESGQVFARDLEGDSEGKHDAEDAGAQMILRGRVLFDALNTACGGHLADWVHELAGDPHATNSYPTELLDAEAPDAHHKAADLPPVTLGHLWPILSRELPRWQGGDRQHSQSHEERESDVEDEVASGWNSLLRVGPAIEGKEQRSVYVSQPRTFTVGKEGHMPPRVILDATANEHILRQLFKARVQVKREEVEPPPSMHHIAVRTGKHYGITAMRTAEYRERAIKEVRHLLRELDSDGALRKAGKVGLITFKGIEKQVAEALYIPSGRTGHFWGIRGSNAFNDCTLLIVLGTPVLNTEELYRMGCALYADSPKPLAVERRPGRDKKWRFADWRLQELSEALTQAELTQVAHRNRPLRFEGRTVVTFCDVDVDFLPETQRIIAFPERLADDGRSQQEVHAEADVQRMERAAAELVGQSVEPKYQRMQEVLRRDGQRGIRAAVLRQFLREWHASGGEQGKGNEHGQGSSPDADPHAA